MISVVSIIISVLALLISAMTAWFTLFWRGALRMTPPAFVAFAYDDRNPKVFLRTMLYTTGKRGRVLEALYLKLRRGDIPQTFPFWSYYDSSRLVAGSGMWVGQDGVSTDHHFLLSRDAAPFAFLAGEYTAYVYARVVNLRGPVLLSTVRLSLSDELASVLRDPSMGVFFTKDPETQEYHAETSPKPVNMRHGE